jgi:hypothetical protein
MGRRVFWQAARMSGLAAFYKIEKRFYNLLTIIDN